MRTLSYFISGNLTAIVLKECKKWSCNPLTSEGPRTCDILDVDLLMEAFFSTEAPTSAALSLHGKGFATYGSRICNNLRCGRGVLTTLRNWALQLLVNSQQHPEKVSISTGGSNSAKYCFRILLMDLAVNTNWYSDAPSNLCCSEHSVDADEIRDGETTCRA